MKKNAEFLKDKDSILENLMGNPIVEINVGLNSYEEKLHSFLQACIYKFIKQMNREIDEQINRNDSIIRMNELLLLESYSNFHMVDFANNQFSAHLLFPKFQKEININLSLVENIQNLALDFFVKILINLF